MKTFEQVITDLENDRKSPRTVELYGLVYNAYGKFLGGRQPSIENAKKFLATKNHLSDASISSYRMAFRTFFNYNGIEIPKGDLKAIPYTNTRQDKFVTRTEVDELVKCCDTLRDKVIIRLLYHAGPRAMELVAMDVGDLEFNKHRVRIKPLEGLRKLKTGPKVRSVRFIRPELVIPTLRAYLTQRGIDPDRVTEKQRKEPLLLGERRKNDKRLGYPGVHKIVKDLGKCISKPDLSPHWLRHGFVVWNKVHGVQPEITAMQIGDTVATTTKIYSHYNQSDVDRVYDELQGKATPEDIKNKDPLDMIEELQESNKNLETRVMEMETRLAPMNAFIQELRDDPALRRELKALIKEG